MGNRMSVGIEDAMAVNSAATQEITVIKDEHGLLFLGDPKEIKAWLDDRGLASREFVTKALRTGGSAVQTAAKVSSESGRWVKLTKDSAKLLEKYGKAGAIQPGVVQKSNGQIIKWLRFENPSQLFSPAMATGVAGMMTQMALEQAIQEITDYLKSIDEKVGELLQDQKDQTVADLIGVVFEVDEAAAIRDKTGTLSDAAWSKLAPCAQTTSRALGYAKLQGISDKLSRAESVDKIEHVLSAAKDDVPAWLVMVSRAVQTRDKLSVIELERAYTELPEVLEEHRLGIVEARRERLGKVKARIDALREVLELSADRVREEKLLHPFAVDNVLGILDSLMEQTSQFSKGLDIEMDEKVIERAPEWLDVAGKFAGDVASGAANGAQQLGGAIADGAGALGEAAGKGAADLGAAVADGVQGLGKVIGNVDLKKAADSLPFKLPFGGK